MPSKRIVTIGLLLWSVTSFADPYDLRLYKLGNPTQDIAANAKFAAFARQFAAGLTSVNLTPPETLGHSAFSVTAELSVVQFDQSDGELAIPTVHNDGTRPGITGALLLPSIHIRKGLPWSFEVGTRVAWIEKSRMGAATGELKWAINEGFTYLPDFGVRAHVTRLFNSKDFDLTAGGLDIGLGKQFAIGGMVTLTPYVGWNMVWVAANSNTIDFNPGRTEVDATATPNAQFADTDVYDEVMLTSNMHNRFYGGFRFITGALQLGAEYSTSRLPRVEWPVGENEPAERKQLPPVNAFNFTVGLDF
ncbi:MAG: hypothetical protein WBV82_32650 [Myxococcaceae bacterium]